MALLQQLGDGLVAARKLVQDIRTALRAYEADSHSSIAQLRKDQHDLPVIVASTERTLTEVTNLAATTQQSLHALQAEIQHLSTQLAAGGEGRVDSLAAAGKGLQVQLSEFTRQVAKALEEVDQRTIQLRQAAVEAAQAAVLEAERQTSEFKLGNGVLAEADMIVRTTYQTAHFDHLAATAASLSSRLQTLAQETLPGEVGKLNANLSGVHSPALQNSYHSASRDLGESHADFQKQGQEAAQKLSAALAAQMDLNQQAVASDLPDQVHAAALKADQAAQQLSKESDVTRRTAAHTATHLKDAQDRYFEAVLALHTELQRMLGGKR